MRRALLQRRENLDSREDETGSQQPPLQQQEEPDRQPRRPKKKKKKTLTRRNPDEREPDAHDRLQAWQETTHPRQQQTPCSVCNKLGHTQDQCWKRGCDYCQGKFHTSKNCREKLAYERQQELVQEVQAVRQETLTALKSFAWQLQQPFPQHRLPAPSLLTLNGLSTSQPLWPYAPPNFNRQYGAAL